MNVLLLDNNKLMGTFWQRRYGCLVAWLPTSLAVLFNAFNVMPAGSIPSELGQLVGMERLELERNEFMGTCWQRRYGCNVAWLPGC